MGAGDVGHVPHGRAWPEEPGNTSGSNVIPMNSLTLPDLQLIQRQLEEELAQLRTNLQALNEALARYKGSQSSLESFSKSSAGFEALIPLTSSIYVPGKLLDTEKVLIDIGTGYHIQKNIADATKYFERNINTVSEEVKKLTIIIQEKQKMFNLTNSYIQQRQSSGHQQGARAASTSNVVPNQPSAE